MPQCHATPYLRELISDVIFASVSEVIRLIQQFNVCPEYRSPFLQAEPNARISPGILNTPLAIPCGLQPKN
jgi:hypothetical protein